MSESDTMFNEQDRRCAAVQLMISTNPSYDSKNDRWISTNKRDVPRVMKTKFPATVMVFGMVSSEGHIMPPHFFEVGLKINTKVYLDVLVVLNIRHTLDVSCFSMESIKQRFINKKRLFAYITQLL